jgi:hypothetical protein
MTIGSFPLVYLFIILALLLPRVPVVGKWFNVINTVVHEAGHALMALLMEGKVHKIEIFQDSSGATTTQCKGKFPNFCVAIVGYPFSAVVAYCIFKLYAVGYFYGIVWGILIFYLVVLLLWIRNLYGFVWVLLFAALNAYLIYLGNETYFQIAALLYATFMTVDSLTSSFVILYLSIKSPANAGDATLLKKFTRVPAFLWAFLFFSFSAYISYLIVRNNPSVFIF